MTTIPRVILKKDDLLPALIATVTDDDGSIVDLTDATAVVFTMADAQTGTVKINGSTASFVAPKTTGKVKYSWASGNTDTVADYKAEFKITWPSGNQRAPQKSYLMVSIIPKLS